MTAISIRINEGCAPLPVPFWDSIWSNDSGSADWALAGPAETQNVGGLAARQALETAVILCLFTDAYCPPSHPLSRYVDPHDRRGWWGDGVDLRADLGEAPLGSLLWTLERAVVTQKIALLAQAAALTALRPMIDEQAVARIDAQAFAFPAVNRLDLAVQIFGRDGAKVYDRRFDDIWALGGLQQIAPSAPSPAPPWPFLVGLPTAEPPLGGLLWNDGGFVAISTGSISPYALAWVLALPASPPADAGLLWSDGGILSVSGAGVSAMTPAWLRLLPTTLPAAAGQPWLDGLVVAIS